MKRTHTLLTLLALAAAFTPRLDGTPPEKKDPEGKKDELRLTPEEWAARERERLGKLSADKVVDELVRVKGENFDLRRKAAPDGGLVLNADERKRWEAWEKLGKPEDVSTALDQGKKDRVVVEKQEKQGALAKIAEAAGWDPETFADLDAMAGGLEWTVQEVGKGEDKVRQVTVKVGDKQVEADAFAEERWKKFLPVLQAGEGSGKADSGPEPEPRTTRVATGGAGGGKGKAYTVADAEQRKADSGQYSM